MRTDSKGSISFFLPGPFFSYRERRDNKMQTIESRLPVPKNKKQARIVHSKGMAVIYDPPKTKNATKALVAALEPYAPPEPWNGSVFLDVGFVFVPPVAWPKWKQEAARNGMIRPNTQSVGDRDNLHKLLADALETAGFFINDAQLVDGKVYKEYGAVPGYEIFMWQEWEPKTNAEWKELDCGKS